MYKVTLYDDTTGGFVSGVALFFCEDIMKFREDLFGLTRDAAKRERFERSLGGEIVTDYHQTDRDEELNIVQTDLRAEILGGRDYSFADRRLELRNFYGCIGVVRAARIEIHIKWIHFRERYYKVGSYELFGVARELPWKGEDGGPLYAEQICWGSPVLRNICSAVERQSVYGNPDFTKYRDNRISSICDICIDEFFDQDECGRSMSHYRLTKREISRLLRDILGEAG